MKASSSRITSSVFQIITRSSKLDNSRALTRGERDDDRQTDGRTERRNTHTHRQTRNAHRKKKWKQNKTKKRLTAKKKLNFTRHPRDEARSPRPAVPTP